MVNASLEMADSGSVKRESISAQIAARLRHEILTGEYAPGDRLPPERELGERFGISRVTVRQALQELAKEEWIEIVQGRGATVTDYGERIGLDALPSLLSASPVAVVTPDAFMTMHEFYNWLYGQICKAAALRAKPAHEKKLMRIINGYEDGISAMRYYEIERDLFRELLSIGGNLVLNMFFNTYIKTFHYLVVSGALPAPLLPRQLHIDFNGEMVAATCAGHTDRIDAVIEKYRPEIYAAMGAYLAKIGVNIT